MQRILILICTSFLITPQVLAQAEVAEKEQDEEEWTFSIYALEEYRFRYATQAHLQNAGGTETLTATESDHDIRLFLGSSITSPKDRFFADVALGAWIDADGTPAPGSSPSLGSMYDSASSVWLDVYSLYAEYHSPGIVSLARLGRQSAEHGRPATFDGATFRARVIKHYLEMFAFGGRTVHFFNVGDNLFEDWLASGGLVIRPARILRFELDYRYLREDTASVDSSIPLETIENHSYGIKGWLYTSDWLYLKAYLRGLDDKVSRVGGATMLAWDKISLGLDLSGDLQLVVLREVNEIDDPYFAILSESRPNFRAHADLWKAFETEVGTYTIHGGWDGRILVMNTPTLFNRDYGKAYVWLEAEDIGIKGPFVSAMFSYNYTHSAPDLGDDNLLAVGGSLGWDRRPLKIEAGTYFSRIKYNYYQTVDERENVRTYFGEIGYRIADWLSVRGKYEFERFDRDVHQATISFAQTY